MRFYSEVYELLATVIEHANGRVGEWISQEGVAPQFTHPQRGGLWFALKCTKLVELKKENNAYFYRLI